MDNVYVLDNQDLVEKIKRIKNAGADKLHIVADFDKTLTKFLINGRQIPSVISLIREGGYLTNDYPRKAYALYDKYHPVELDDTISIKDKNEKMLEWWRTHEKLLVESGMNKSVIDDIIKKYPDILRVGADEFFNLLHRHKIPLLIFSSGVGNIIEGYIKKDYDNIHILSNTFNFDKKGYATGYKEDIIHVFNKSETAIKNEKYLKAIFGRRNIILLGDSLGDLGMVKGIKYDTLISIGFLNEEIDKKLSIYMKNFDVVITNDGDMGYANKLIEELV
ncbi:2-hydroxy-3-keto-5-methylthiopentenyl-1-phosphatephosphatase [Candidatus Tiddalikarchaeum anstoanum]|nr:2-hydroxy-3-keto-5-methylthiopentenyl-1-phosphatephosphatase [Candidatus Tiddalikarchaeum anstoanum]